MKASKDEWHALSSLIALAGIHNRLEDNARVEDYLAQAKAIAERIHSKEHLAEIYALYHRYYSRRGLYQQALASKEQADALQDSVISIEKINRIQNASINIERSRQRQQMDAVQLKLRQEKTKWEVGFGIFLLTLIVLVAVMVVLIYIYTEAARPQSPYAEADVRAAGVLLHQHHPRIPDATDPHPRPQPRPTAGARLQP